MEKPLKELGQNFLIKESDIQAFIDFCNLEKDDIVLEIGPGNGALTKYISTNVSKVIGVELDSRMVSILNNLKIENLEIENYNFLDLNLRKLIEKEKITKIIGAIPYYISSPIIHKIIEEATIPLTKVYLITQKEFAEKVLGKKDRRSYFTNLIEKYASLSLGKTISKDSFYPVPKVDSMYFNFTFNTYPKNILQVKKWEKFLHMVFKNPRKKINKVFSLEVLQTAKINENIRPQNLTIKNTAMLYKINNTIKNKN